MILTKKPEQFAIDAPDYDQATAEGLCELACAAYQEEYGWRCDCYYAGWGVDGGMSPLIKLFDVDGAQAGLAISRYCAVVAFRGSSECCDWRDDFTICPGPWPTFGPGRTMLKGSVCRGFSRQLSKLAAPLLDALKQPDPKLPLFITGHSLGGALAPLFAMVCRSKGLNVRACYTFESPRWCTAAAAADYDYWLRRRTFRVVVVEGGEQDLVTRVPLSKWGFAHVGTPEILIDGVRHENAEKWEQVRGARPVGHIEGWRVLRRTVRGIHAHLSSSVLTAVRKAGAPAARLDRPIPIPFMQDKDEP